jgi:hypothetical protein
MTAFGFSAIGTTDGSDYHGKMRDAILDDGANMFVGDMMILGGTALAADTLPRITPAASAAAGNTLLGALASIYPDFTDEGSLTRNYHLSGSDGVGKIVEGSEVVYACREDALVDPIDGTEIGGSVDLITGTGSTITGMSGMALDSDSAALDKAQALNLLALNEQQGNVFEATVGGTGAIFNVSINPVA